jgi:hypothetical protein
MQKKSPIFRAFFGKIIFYLLVLPPSLSIAHLKPMVQEDLSSSRYLLVPIDNQYVKSAHEPPL